MKVLGIIPARYASTRFPGKPLIDIRGKTMIQRVYEQVKKCKNLNEVIVATDDERIHSHVELFGGKVIMTSKKHPSGTDRCNEVLSTLSETYDFVINIQGDEPFVHPEQIDQLIDLLDRDIELATLAKKIEQHHKLLDPNAVKVVIDHLGFAIYFSRAAIPFNRDTKKHEDWLLKTDYFKHIGIYAYRSDVLKKITSLPPSALETIESLEQLRWLENGYKIKVGITDLESPNIDSPEDLSNLNF